MTKKYDTPLAELLILSSRDIVTSSGDFSGGSSGGSTGGSSGGSSSGGDWVIDGGAL